MPRIIWNGLTKSNYEFKTDKLPENSKMIHIPQNNMSKSILFAIPFFLLCFFVLFIRFQMNSEFSLNKPYGFIGLVLGISLSVVHEILHAIVYPKNYNAYIGIIPKDFMFYMSCSAPLKKGRFILMSLFPMILGIIPFVIFTLTPAKFEILNTIMWPIAMIGLVSPCPDYLNVYYVLKEVPKHAYIQDGDDGLYWFMKE